MRIVCSKTHVKGKVIKVWSMPIDDLTVNVTGKWLRTAVVHDEAWLEGEVVKDPEDLIAKLKAGKLTADIFTFSQKLPDTDPKYRYPIVQDNVAAILTDSMERWWEKLPQATRKSVRRGYKRGVIAKACEFDDEYVKGIVSIQNETPIRQGVPFTHYGKDFSVVKREYGTYLERSQFLGAYYESELIGMLKFVYVGSTAMIMNILSKNQHFDKRPSNILIAKAVEICNKNGVSFLVYGNYTYGNKTNSPVTEFKRRNGFENILLPTYYVPLTLRGKVAIKLKLHLGLLGILPESVIALLQDLRSRYYKARLMLSGSGEKLQTDNRDQGLATVEHE